MILALWTYSRARAICIAIFSFCLQVAGMAVADGAAQVLALQELHHHVQPVLFVAAEVVDADDVFVGEIAGRAGFGEEAGFGLLVLAGGVGEDLDRDGTADHGVHGAIHVGHAAAEEFQQFVFADACWELNRSPRNVRMFTKILYHDMDLS